MASNESVRHLPPPSIRMNITGRLRRNFFSNPTDALMTVVIVMMLYATLPHVVKWMLTDATFAGETRAACTGGGACWVFVKVWIRQFIYGFYPLGEQWRINVVFLAFVLLLAVLRYAKWRHKTVIGPALLFGFPIVAMPLLYGGVFGLPVVGTGVWGGLFLTVTASVVGLVFSLPLGVLLAMGRQSELPAIRALAVLYIELLRGSPLVIILFMASVLFPILLPPGVIVDNLLRTLVAIVLFTAAEVAECVRGGLQAIPKGQYEGSKALGLGYWQRMALVIVPQALKISIPGLVNTFIGLFMSSTLLIIIGVLDLLGTVQAALTNPDWIGFSAEGYVFVAAVFWVFCFAMSRYSVNMERKLNRSHRH